MFYLSGRKHGSKYGVVDSSDGSEDFLSVRELLSAERAGYGIYGFMRKSGYLYCFGVNSVIISLLDQSSHTPVMLKLADGLEFSQTIYMGHRIYAGELEFVFFNDSGVSGICIATSKQFLSGEVSIDFNHIDDRRAEVLLRRLKDSGGFKL